MYTYLFIFNSIFGNRDYAISVIRQIPSIVRWRSDMPNVIYIKSNDRAQQLCEAVRGIRGIGKFLIVEITGNRQGYLSKETWNFIKSNLEE